MACVPDPHCGKPPGSGSAWRMRIRIQELKCRFKQNYSDHWKQLYLWRPGQLSGLWQDAHLLCPAGSAEGQHGLLWGDSDGAAGLAPPRHAHRALRLCGALWRLPAPRHIIPQTGQLKKTSNKKMFGEKNVCWTSRSFIVVILLANFSVSHFLHLFQFFHSGNASHLFDFLVPVDSSGFLPGCFYFSSPFPQLYYFPVTWNVPLFGSGSGPRFGSGSTFYASVFISLGKIFFYNLCFEKTSF